MQISSVVASSGLKMPLPSLHGYAFSGADLVIGDLGHTSHGPVPAGHDGCYVSAVRDEETGEVTVGTDAAGLGRLFCYQTDGRWALGRSLFELAEHVAQAGWPLTADRTRLRSFLIHGYFGEQLSSLRTAFDEIRLLRPAERAVITPGRPPGPTLGKASSPVGDESPALRIEMARPAFAEDYPEALSLALGEMVGRLRTVLHWDLPIGSDITGGRDSRVILAALRIANDTGRPLGEVVDFTSHEHWARDWEVASHLSRRYRLQVNADRPGRRLEVEPWAGFDMWRRNDLGVYAPIYAVRSFPLRLGLSGAGGGGHRIAAQQKGVATRMRANASPLQSTAEIDQLIAETEESLGHAGSHPDQRVAFGQLFRERFHGGRQALRSLQMPPLASARLRYASGLLPLRQAERAQFFADIMISLAPDLAFEPYDDPAKGWDLDHQRDATRVRPARSRLHGRVYGTLQTPPVQRIAGLQPLDPFREVYHRSAPSVIESGVLPEDYVNLALPALKASDGRVFKHATHAVPLSHTIFVAEALRLAGNLS